MGMPRTFHEAREVLANGGTSVTAMVRAALDLAKEKAHLNIFLELFDRSALAKAAEVDAKVAAGNAGPLAGAIVSIKDNLCYAGHRVSAASRMLDGYVSPYSATVVERLLAADTVIIGRTNCDEFAMGSSNESSAYGPVANPWDPARVPGGSSGGAAASVAAGLCHIALASDTGGSIRQPASLCGVSGIKPTYGAVSRYGMIAFASSLDQAGPMAPGAEDLAWLLASMQGYDERDSTSLDRPVPDYPALLEQDMTGLRIGLPREYFGEGLDASVASAVQEAVRVYERLGATIVDIELPNSKLAVPTYYVVAPAEASSNLARFDGVRYGYRCDSPRDLMDMYRRSRGEGFGSEVKRRIMIGTYVLSSGYYDAYYLKAQKLRRLISADFARAFEKVDVIMGPTAPETAFRLGAKQDPLSMYLSDIYTIAVNLAGLPGMSIPCGFAGRFPVGLQLIGNYFTEARLLALSHRYQLETDWHRRVPEGCA